MLKHQETPVLVDSHCHLHDREFFTEEEALKCLERAQAAGVEKIICIGTSHEDSLAAREFASKHENVYWTYGVHPESAGVADNVFFKDICRFSSSETYIPDGAEKAARRADFPGRPAYDVEDEKVRPEKDMSDRTPAKPVAIGEVGLDYHYEGYNRKAQIRLFEEMLQLASDNGLPLSFHIREAFEDFFPVVANFPGVRGVVHSFTDSKKTLKRILAETEFYVGVNGLATYSTLPLPPLERILLETDAPFLAPVPHRGETNQPAYVANVADWLAQKLELPKDEVAQITTDNATALFAL